MSLFDLCMQLWHALIVKRHFTTHQDVKNNTKTPNIHFWSCVLLGLQEFWGSKVKASAKRLELASRREQIAEAKIDDFDVASLADEDVLNLEVTVDNAIAVTVVQRTGNLSGKFAGLLLLETAVRDDVVKHLATVDEFE
jgi:hypothetical protein